MHSVTPKNSSHSFMKIIVGCLFLVFGTAMMLGWWPEFMVLVKGCSGMVAFCIGIIFLVISRKR